MRIPESCAKCLYDKQKNITDQEVYLSEIRQILADRKEDDTSPYMLYLFNQVYEKHFGRSDRYSKIKKKYNDLMLSMEADIRMRIHESEDPLKMALFLSRLGNYIDFGALNSINNDTLLELLSNVHMSERDQKTYQDFLCKCKNARTFLLITDNCGEIVLDKLMIEQLKLRFPDINVTVLVRGSEVLNDATVEDATYVGIDKAANVVSNGKAVAGTVYDLLSDEARQVLDHSDVILAKGQGNYESLCRQGRHIFYMFLCKCELFTQRFGVPNLTGMFVEEA